MYQNIQKLKLLYINHCHSLQCSIINKLDMVQMFKIVLIVCIMFKIVFQVLLCGIYVNFRVREKLVVCREKRDKWFV